MVQPADKPNTPTYKMVATLLFTTLSNSLTLELALVFLVLAYVLMKMAAVQLVISHPVPVRKTTKSLTLTT